MTRPFPLKVLLPLALGVIVSIAVLVFSEFGYRRLDVANRQSTTALEMEARLNDVMQLVVDAETAQRGYLLTGDGNIIHARGTLLYRISEPGLRFAFDFVNASDLVQNAFHARLRYQTDRQSQ